MEIQCTDYFRYKAQLRGFDLAILTEIVRYSPERYSDTVTQRNVVVGKHRARLVMVAYEQHQDTLTPVTVHAVTRQQVTYRVKTGRFTIYE